MKHIANVQIILYFTILIEPDGSEFHAYSPQLKGLHVQAETVKKTVLDATDATRVYVESLIKHGEPLPKDTSVSVISTDKATTLT